MKKYGLVTLLLLTFWCSSVLAQTIPLKSIQPSVDFFAYPKPMMTSTSSDEIEVIYFFWYGSPWSYQIDKQLRTWMRSQSYNIKLIPSPAYFDDNHQIFAARVFFALKLLGKEQEISPLFLEAVSKKEIDFDSIQATLRWMSNHGIAERNFLKALNDPRTKTLTSDVPRVMKLYQIQSVPTVVLNGKYMVRAYDKVSPDKFLQVVELLTQQLSKNITNP